MEWNKVLVLQLIDEYAKYPILWNSTHPQHYSRNKKVDAWDTISKKLNINVAEIKQKINSLLGSLRREKAKGKKSVGTGKAAVEIYKSKWFAFKRMEFLLYKNEPICTINTEEGDNYEDQTNLEQDETENSLMSIASETYTSENRINEQIGASENRTSEKTKENTNKSQNEARSEEAYRILKETVVASREPTPTADSYFIYGLHIANKLRTYSKRTCTEVENAINQILYAADIGKYDVFTTSPQSPHFSV